MDYDWVCNECGSHEYNSSVNSADLERWLACSSCGCNEFHKEYITTDSTGQPPVAG